MYFEYYLMGIILLPGIILATIAQIKVSKSFSAFSKVTASCGKTASEVARMLLDQKGLTDISVIKTNGHLTDYYDSKKKVIALSSSVYDSSSIAAIGVAAHEVGHAYQYAEKYIPIKIRQAVIPIANFASTMLWPLVVLGLIFNFAVFPGSIVGNVLLWCGIAVFGLSVLVNLATLPVEYNASNRAIKTLQLTNTLTPEELNGAKQVLKSAALTYFASLVISMLNLLRFLLVFARFRSDD